MASLVDTVRFSNMMFSLTSSSILSLTLRANSSSTFILPIISQNIPLPIEYSQFTPVTSLLSYTS